MPVACYFCNTDIPRGGAKRCSRCRLVVYCSKECQKKSWKLTHKKNCVAHPSIEALDGKEPEKFSTDWIELEVDKTLSKWIAEWRSCFMLWTTIALDLANHPPDRVMTHCLHIVVEPRHFESKSYRNYRAIHAEILPLSQIKQTHPQLITHIDPNDFTRLRFVVTLQNTKGELRRVRLIQWNDLNLSSWSNMPKDDCAKLAKGAPEALMYAVEDMTPADVQKMLGETK